MFLKSNKLTNPPLSEICDKRFPPARRLQRLTMSKPFSPDSIVAFSSRWRKIQTRSRHTYHPRQPTARLTMLVLLNLILRTTPALVLSIFLVALMAYPIPGVSEQNQAQPDLNRVIQDVQKAESSGATSAEMQALLFQLNYVVELQDQMQNLSPQDTDSRTKNLVQINETLAAVDAEANHIAVISSQRSFFNRLSIYLSGVIGAVLATIACHYSLLLWRKYRIKRTFQMKLIPK